jgi:sugar diacid utilization regulator
MTTNASDFNAPRPTEWASAGQSRLSNLYGVFVLSALMFDGRSSDGVLALAANAVPSLTRCRTEAVYRIENGTLKDVRAPSRELESPLDALVSANLGVDHEIVEPDGAWRFAIALRAQNDAPGVIVVRSTTPASQDELFLLKVMAQQAAAAMTSADLLESERARRVQLNELTEEHERTIRRLSRTVAELERRQQIHSALSTLSVSAGGENGIADTLHELTSRAVTVEDAFGGLLAWSGGSRPVAYQPIGGHDRDEVLRHAAASGRPEHDGDRLFCVIRPKGTILGVLSLHVPKRGADELDGFALEYAATVLGLELSHQRSLAEAELRLRRDLVEDLLAGTDDESAYLRASALGHNLHTPHCFTVLRWQGGVNTDDIAKAAHRWAATAGLQVLTARRQTMTILLTDGVPAALALHRAVSAHVGSHFGSIGIGTPANAPSALPKSFSEAQRALQVLEASVDPSGVRRFDELGVYRIFDPGDDRPEVRDFVTEWLGPLMIYDRKRNADLVRTLAHYLDSGGNYDLTAQSLNIHRSTLRYRLKRIREISGRDTQDVDTRLNLHLATKVRDVVGDSDFDIEAGDA